MSGKIYVAKGNAQVRHDGRLVHLKAGVTTVREGHPIHDAHPDLFREFDVTYEYDQPAPADKTPVETATADPGETKSVRPTRGPRRQSARKDDGQ